MTKFKTDISKQGKQFELVFTTDNKDYFEKVQSVARDCIDHKPITNFDRIKAMSVEELANFIPNWSYTKACKCDEEIYVDCNNECWKCVKEWLESEVQGE